jgi:hypothetical protein
MSYVSHMCCRRRLQHFWCVSCSFSTAMPDLVLSSLEKGSAVGLIKFRIQISGLSFMLLGDG